MNPASSHQEELHQTKTSPTSVVFNVKSGRLAKGTSVIQKSGSEAGALSSKEKPTNVSSTMKTENTEATAMPSSSDQLGISPGANVSTDNNNLETLRKMETADGKKANEGYVSPDRITKSQNPAPVRKAVGVKQSILCRLRISPPKAQLPVQSENTSNLDTFASLACQVAEEQTHKLRPKIQQSVSFALPATILGKRSNEYSGNEKASKAQKTVHGTRKPALDAPSALANKSLNACPTSPQVGDVEMTTIDGHPDEGSNIPDDRIPVSRDRPQANVLPIGSSPEVPMGMVQEAAADHIATAKDRLIMNGERAGLSAEEQVSLALKNSTCRSAMQDVMQQLEEFKERVAAEFGCLRHELEETKSQLRAVEEENCRMAQFMTNCECHGLNLSPEGPPPNTIVPRAGTNTCHEADKSLAKKSKEKPHREERGGKGPSPGLSIGGGSQSSGSQLSGEEGRSLLVLRAASESDSTPFEIEGPRRSSRRGRGSGSSKRRRDNWTLTENADFLRLVRENKGMEEMDLRRMLAKFFSPRRTHEQCANHLRILRAQKKVPPAVGEAVPYRQKGAGTNGL